MQRRALLLIERRGEQLVLFHGAGRLRLSVLEGLLEAYHLLLKTDPILLHAIDERLPVIALL
jgi:phage tail protein X